MSIDWDKPIETVSGKPAKVISRDYKPKHYPWAAHRAYDIVVQFEGEGESESRIGFYTPEGRPVYAYPLLRNKTKKVTKWYNLYAEQPGVMYMDHEETARGSTLHGKPPLKTLSIEIEVPCD